MTEQENKLHRFTIEIPGLPGLDEETRQRLGQVGVEEVLEKSSLNLVSESGEAPEAHQARRHFWFAARGLLVAGTTIGAVIAGLYAASGRWLDPVYRRRREAGFTDAWIGYLDNPQELEEQLEVLFQAHSLGIDLDNKGRWKGAFGEGARSCLEAIDQRLETTGESWPALKQELENKGMNKSYLDLMEELKKESQSGDGQIRQAWEAINKQGLLRPPNVFLAAYAADVAKTWKVFSKDTKISRRDFLRGFTAPHIREAVGKAIQETGKE